jgi:hypothetical protein
MCFKSSKPAPMASPDPAPAPQDLQPDIGEGRKQEDLALTGTTKAPDLRVRGDAGLTAASGDVSGLKM